MKILVRMTNWVGDCLLATPALKALRGKFPAAEISVLVKGAFAPLFAHNPDVNAVIALEQRRGFRGVADRLKLARRLRGQNFDAAYIFPRSWDSALIPFLARIPTRVGYGSGGRGLLLTRSQRRTRPLRRLHQSQYYFNLVAGSPALPATEKKATLVLPPETEKWAESYFADHFAGKKVVGLAPGATFGSAKMWLPERYWDLASRLLENPKIAVVFFGNQKEREWIEPMGKKEPRARVLAGQTSLLELAALMKRCSVIATNDSGPMHLAAAVRAPLVALFGPTNYENTHPFGEHTAIRKRVGCSPCLLRHCPIDHRCMTQISVDEVHAAILKKLGL